MGNNTDNESAPGAGAAYTCEWCGATYASKRGLRYHKAVCEHRPAGDGLPEGGDTPGVSLWPEDGDRGPGPGPVPPIVAAEAYDDVEYVCPACGYAAGWQYQYCPACGTGVSWEGV